ncbi:ATP-dependent DNA ligase [Candidatus Dependentiae bacterium]|nr:ATP-dependent DNA ligase [Candidatus Dependentiae bacterium]
MEKIKFGKYVVEISNKDKILFPKAKLTKGDLIDYYREIGDQMILYTQDRPISMVRYPNGIKKKGFYQKDAQDYFPKWIKTKKIKKQKDGHVDYVIIDNVATLVYLANLATIAPHLWLSRIDKLNYPDRMIFDLDPSDGEFKNIRKGALLIKKKLDELKIKSFPMITGSRGIHVVVPIKREKNFDWVRSFATDFSELMAGLHADIFTTAKRKSKRKKLIFIDMLRNAFGQTSVAPYGVRPKENAPVATPISWDEVSDSSLKPNKYTIKTIFKRLSSLKKDPWKGIDKSAQSLKKARKQLDDLIGDM